MNKFHALDAIYFNASFKRKRDKKVSMIQSELGIGEIYFVLSDFEQV